MTTTVAKRYAEGAEQVTDGATRSDGAIEYVIHSINSDGENLTKAEALAALKAGAPAIDGGLFANDYSVEFLDESGSESYWLGFVKYGELEFINVGSSPRVRFSTGGGNLHITQSLGTKSYVSSGSAPDHGGAIGVTSEGVQGVDILVPNTQWSETHRFNDTKVSTAYIKTLANATGRTNKADFREFAAGEVLFLGAEGGKINDSAWEITFNFAASPNITTTIAGISGIQKNGWEYLWIQHEEKEDTAAKRIVRKAIAVYVEQVYFEADFAVLDIGV